MTYNVFVTELICAMRPILPGDVSPELAFSGSPMSGRHPGPDAALLSGRRALVLHGLAKMTEDITGIPSRLYKPELSPVMETPKLAHGVYARNLRRWRAGTLPRKIKVRADLVLVTTCWLLRWMEVPFWDEDELQAREHVSELLDDNGPTLSLNPNEMVERLWHASGRAYQESLLRHRETGI